MRQKIRTYYLLTKPGIIYGNVFTTIAGFLLASRGHVNLGLFLATLFGVSLVIASACVLNNYIDRNIDKKMERTKKRALVTHAVSPANAIIFAIILGVLGFTDLILFTNFLTFFIGLVGFVDYLVLYGLSKRWSVHGTVIGSISGATPIAAGYTAVTNRFDMGALILFSIMVFWQMPHFYAIAMYRIKDYAAAGLPVLPVKKGISSTKLQIFFYLIAFILATALLTPTGLTGNIFLIVVGILGITWVGFDIQGFMTTNNSRWARKMFFFSLIAVMVLCIGISVDAFLPVPWK